MEQSDGEKEGQNKLKERVRQPLERLFWWQVCPELTVFHTEIFPGAWGSVSMVTFWFWTMTKAVGMAAYIREIRLPLFSNGEVGAEGLYICGCSHCLTT